MPSIDYAKDLQSTHARALSRSHSLSVSLLSFSLSDSPTLPPVSASLEQDAHSHRICFHAWWGLTRSCSSLTRIAASSPTLFSSYETSLGIGRQDAKVPLAAGEAPSSAPPGGSCAFPGIHKLLYSVYILAPDVHRAPRRLLMRRPFRLFVRRQCRPRGGRPVPPCAGGTRPYSWRRGRNY
jgi:hypothetical protein